MIAQQTSVLNPPETPTNVRPRAACSLQDYLDCANYFNDLKESLTAEGWKRFKQTTDRTLLNGSLKILGWWDQLTEETKRLVEGFDFGFHLSISVLGNLSKIPAQLVSDLISRLRELSDRQGYLKQSDISKTAKLFQPNVKRHLNLEEEMESDDWQLVGKKYQLAPEALEEVKALAQELAQGETLLVDNTVDALAHLGYDAAKVLPKPKKKYTEADVSFFKNAVTTLTETVESLQQQIANMMAKNTERVESLQQQIANMANTAKNSPGRRDESNKASAELLDSSEPTSETSEVGSQTTLSEIHSIDQLIGSPCFYYWDDLEVEAEFRGQKTSAQKAQIKIPDGKVLMLKFSEIFLEFNGKLESLAVLIKQYGWNYKKVSGFGDLRGVTA
jgi:hypothetical protein